MKEHLLQFIWQFRYYNARQLLSTTGESITVIHPGLWNTNQGPDFLDARIRIGETLLAGNIEIHCRASDWNRHQHQYDERYANVILHVVWEQDIIIRDKHWAPIPTIELNEKVAHSLLNNYQRLMQQQESIPCGGQIARVPHLTLISLKERMLTERLIRKSGEILDSLKASRHHWEAVFWWTLARNFGIRVNAAAFEAIARSIPLTVLTRHKTSLFQVEALLMGQGGLLEKEFKEEYPQLLQAEYRYLSRKYELSGIHSPVQFLRMRPQAFPTIRLAQLAALFCGANRLFAQIREAESLVEIRNMLNAEAAGYWEMHYNFGEASAARIKKLGTDMVENIIINTIAPVIFAYGHYYNEDGYKEKAVNWLASLKPEQNQVTRIWKSLGLENQNAADSQALIELKNQYCNEKKCLGCSAGHFLIST